MRIKYGYWFIDSAFAARDAAVIAASRMISP
jgi:hypothetical protein